MAQSVSPVPPVFTVMCEESPEWRVSLKAWSIAQI